MFAKMSFVKGNYSKADSYLLELLFVQNIMLKEIFELGDMNT